MSTKASNPEIAKESDIPLPPVSKFTPGDILESLKKEHDEVKTLLNKLQGAQAAKERRELVKKIKIALVPHTKAEERVVYDAVIATSEEEAEVDGHEGYLEHEWASKTLQRLEAAEPASTEHKAAARVLKDLVDDRVAGLLATSSSRGRPLILPACPTRGFAASVQFSARPFGVCVPQLGAALR